MVKKLFIRSAAIKLLEKIYLESDNTLKATINAFDIIDNNNIDKLIIQKAGLYLEQKQLIETSQIASEKWTAIITYKGIDWLEDNIQNSSKWLY